MLREFVHPLNSSIDVKVLTSHDGLAVFFKNTVPFFVQGGVYIITISHREAEFTKWTNKSAKQRDMRF